MKEYSSQCLFYALNRWHKDGGYLLLGRSTHWCIPHVLHMSNKGEVSHFAPNQDLRTPWHSLLGFKGVVFDRDSYERAPMNILCMFLGTIALFVFGGVWTVKTYYLKLKEKLYDSISRKR